MANEPIRILSLGAGVQSSTLLRMCIAGEVEPISHAIFCDTGWEPQAVYEHLKILTEEAEAAGIKVHTTSKGNLREDSLKENTFADIPLHTVSPTGKSAIGRRQCTTHYKLRPLLKKQREIAGLIKHQKCSEHRVTTLIGISWDETERMKDAPSPWIVNEYPLVDRRMTRSDCLTWNKQKGFPLPPRSSCIGCPLHSDKEWRAIKNNPRDWEDAVDFDQKIRDMQFRGDETKTAGQSFLYYKKIPLIEADFRTEEEKGQGVLFGNECEGMCGL